jgi:hypothetical protein
MNNIKYYGTEYDHIIDATDPDDLLYKLGDSEDGEVIIINEYEPHEDCGDYCSNLELLHVQGGPIAIDDDTCGIDNCDYYVDEDGVCLWSSYGLRGTGRKFQLYYDKNGEECLEELTKDGPVSWYKPAKKEN